MTKYQIIKRTFEAKKFPKGSEMRVKLNKTCVTSEYLTSNKFCILSEDGKFSSGHKNRTEAEKFKSELENTPAWKSTSEHRSQD